MNIIHILVHFLSRKFLQIAGFTYPNIYPSFGGQFLSLEALPARDQRKADFESFHDVHEIEEICKSAVRFADLLGKAVEGWHQKLEDLRVTGKKVVIWGTGSKGVTFLNMVDRGGGICHRYQSF